MVSLSYPSSPNTANLDFDLSEDGNTMQLGFDVYSEDKLYRGAMTLTRAAEIRSIDDVVDCVSKEWFLRRAARRLSAREPQAKIMIIALNFEAKPRPTKIQ